MFKIFLFFIDRDQTQIEPFSPRHNVVVVGMDLGRAISLLVSFLLIISDLSLNNAWLTFKKKKRFSLSI